MSKLTHLGFLFVCVSIFTACEPRPISEVSPDEGIGRLRENHQEKNWERLITEVNEYRSRYPYTQFASEAELLQADAYFQADKYPEAIAAYDEFLRKNPSHPSADFAMFRAARCYDLQSPEEIDREQLNATKGLTRYGSFLERFPTSATASEAKERIEILRRRVADHSAFVAHFYWKKDLYQGALTRYLQILKEYPMYDDLRELAAERASQSYFRLADELQADPKSDLKVFFKNDTPDGLRKKGNDIVARASASSSKKEPPQAK